MAKKPPGPRPQPPAPTPDTATTRALRTAALALVLLLAAALSWRTETGHDFGFHLATGRLILQRNAWPRVDEFTYTVAGSPYIDMHGLFQVAMALVFGAAGYAGLGCMRIGLVLATVALLWIGARRRGARAPALLLGGFLVGLLAWEFRLFLRPELATTLCLAAQLYLLRRHEESGGAAWVLLCAPLQLLWVYSHALSLFGIAVLGLYALAGLAGPRRADRMPWVALALAAGAMFLNPYGAEGVAFLWNLRSRLESDNVFAGAISELASPLSASLPGTAGFLAFKCLLLGSLVLVVLRAARIGVFGVALVALFGALSATAMRNIGLFVVAALPVALQAGQQCLDSLDGGEGAARRAGAPRAPGAARRPGGARVAIGAAIFATLAAAGVRLLVGIHSGGYYGERFERFGSGPSPLALPVGTARYLRQAPQLPGPLFNTLDVGGYLESELWPARRVFVDGRLEVLGEEFYAEVQRIDSGEDWDAMLRRYDPNVALVPYTSGPLLLRLLRDPQWAPVSMDGASALLLRNRPGNQAALESAITAWSAENREVPGDSVPLAPHAFPSPVARFFGRCNVPWDSMRRGDALLAFGLQRAAWREYRHALAATDLPDAGLIRKYVDLSARLGHAEDARLWAAVLSGIAGSAAAGP